MRHDAAAHWGGQTWEALEALVDADGSGVHRHVARLRRPGVLRRDLADACHALCAVHGTHPGMADDARANSTDPAVSAWLEEVADGFARERQLLARTVSAAGPLPSTPGQAATEAAFVSSRHALQTLARSGRAGCAAGAVAALVVDWMAVRRVFAHAADLFGAPVAPLGLPPTQETATVLAMAAGSDAAERAAMFGAQQLLAQHRALWDLLEARAAAREG
jgi:hypothetical protein